MERFSGSDAMFWHLEDEVTPMHTLKVVVLDTSRRGLPVTLDCLIDSITPYLGLVPRSTQRVVAAKGFGGRPYWVTDEHFDLPQHLDEVTLLAPGDRIALDDLLGELAMRPLDRNRPLWRMTLVHGLENGQQAVVVQVHHAICDGVAALNMFLAATTDAPGGVPDRMEPEFTRAADADTLRLHARAGVRDHIRGVRRLARLANATRKTSAEFRRTGDLPPRIGARRTVFNARSGAARVCASATIDFADLKTIARATESTINGALHSVIAGAVREEFRARGQSLDQPAIAIFGVCHDTARERRWGNAIATASVYLRVDIADPIERLRATARSCTRSVERRRAVGFELPKALAHYTARLAPRARSLFGPRTPVVVNHITTANVAGPDHLRWFGDIAVADWISVAVAVAPADVNLTAYSYNGRLSVGLVATPESLPNPAGLLARLQPAVDELLAALDSEPLCA